MSDVTESVRKSKRTIELCAEDLIVWAEKLSGRTVTETAERLKESEGMVKKRRRKVEHFVKAGGFDVNNYRLPIFALYETAVGSLMKLLEQCHPQTTMFFFEKMGIMPGNTEWMDKLAEAIKQSGSTVVNNVHVGAVDPATVPDNERNEIRKNLGGLLRGSDRF